MLAYLRAPPLLFVAFRSVSHLALLLLVLVHDTLPLVHLQGNVTTPHKSVTLLHPDTHADTHVRSRARIHAYATSTGDLHACVHITGLVSIPQHYEPYGYFFTFRKIRSAS